MRQPQTERAIAIIKSIPHGRVCTYGRLAALAGYGNGPQSARQVVRILSSLSEKENLPWWRVVKQGGTIALPRGAGLELQRELLKKEGVAVDAGNRIDLSRYLWFPALDSAIPPGKDSAHPSG